MTGTRPLSNKERARRYKEKHPERVKQTQRASKLKAKFGITLDEFDRLFAAQGNACAICHSHVSAGSKGFYVDHCHQTNTVRGILCHHCNLVLGYARDDKSVLSSAISYLNNPPAHAVLH